jgi:hypothetical protein
MNAIDLREGNGSNNVVVIVGRGKERMWGSEILSNN